VRRLVRRRDSLDRHFERLRATADRERDDGTDLVLAHLRRDVAVAADAHVVDGNDDVVRLELVERRPVRVDGDHSGADGAQHDLLAVGLQGDRGGDLLGAAHVLKVDRASLPFADARRVYRARGVEIGALVQAAEQLLEPRCLAHDHVDEVDAAMLRVVAAGDDDERCDGVGLVGQEDVVVRPQRQQSDEDREADDAERHQPAGRDELHSRLLDMPPSTSTVVPLMYDARSEAMKQTTSPNSRGVPIRPSGICASSSGGGPLSP
jgi:hypothetical protein